MKLDVIYENGVAVSVSTVKDDDSEPMGVIVDGNPAEIPMYGAN